MGIFPYDLPKKVGTTLLKNSPVVVYSLFLFACGIGSVRLIGRMLYGKKKSTTVVETRHIDRFGGKEKIMAQEINFDAFEKAFVAGRDNHFSRAGLRTLFEHLEARNYFAGEEWTAGGICAEYTEYESDDELRFEYGCDIAELQDDRGYRVERILIPDSDRFIMRVF